MGKSMSRLNLSVAFERRSGGGNLLSQEDWVSLVAGLTSTTNGLLNENLTK